MRVILWTICVGMTVSLVGSAQQRQFDMEQLLGEEYGKENVADIPAAEKQRLIKEMRGMPKHLWIRHGMKAQRLLIELGDPEMIEARASYVASKNMLDRNGETYQLSTMKQPLLIPAVVSVLFREEDPSEVRVTYDISGFPPSVCAAQVIRGVIIHSPGFAPEVKAWAESIYRYEHTRVALGELREDMRAFWKENEKHFQKGDYAAVRPPKQKKSGDAPGKPAQPDKR